MQTTLFYIIAVLSIASAVVVISVKNVLYAAMALVITLGSSAALFILLQAEFAAIAQVMVYIGGLVIFVVFTILLTTRLGDKTLLPTSRVVGTAGIFGFVTLLILLSHIASAPNSSLSSDNQRYVGLVEVGSRLVSAQSDGYVIAFEVVSLLLLAVIIGAITVARSELPKSQQSQQEQQ